MMYASSQSSLSALRRAVGAPPTTGLLQRLVVIDLLGEVVEDPCWVASSGLALREDGSEAVCGGGVVAFLVGEELR